MDTHSLLKEGSPYIVSGLLMLSGVAFAFVRDLPRKIASVCERIFIAGVTIASDDPLYESVRVWLDRHPYSRKAKNFTAASPRANEDDADVPQPFLLTPAFGEHLIRHRERFVWLERSCERNGNAQPARGRKREEITFRMLGGGRAHVEQLLADIVAATSEVQRTRTRVYVNGDSWWKRVATREPRPLDTLILADGVLEHIVADLEQFYASRTWYREMGIPFRRGLLLHGPPGTGKSSLVGALAGVFGMPLHLLSLTNEELGDAELVDLMHELESEAFVLLEDLDAAFDGREQRKKTGVTLSGLLNAIDGAGAKDGVVLFVSTNHVDRLDPALLRPGRLDVHVKLDYAAESQRRRLFERFYPASPLAAEFARVTDGKPLTVAELQEFLLERRDNGQRAVNEAPAWCRSRPDKPGPDAVNASSPPPSEAGSLFVRVFRAIRENTRREQSRYRRFFQARPS